MDLDGQAIERRDFPISRRGYEPAAVDAHLRAIAAAVGTLRSEVSRGETLGENAGSQVQGILDAAQSAAAEIVGDAKARAAEELRQAQAAAAEIRSDALAKADAHVAAVSEASAALRRRLQAMEGQLGALTSSLQQGSASLTQDLGGVRQEMAALYDAAAGRSSVGDEQGGGAAASAGSAPAWIAPAAAQPEAQEPVADVQAAVAPAAPSGNGASTLSAAQVELDVADQPEHVQQAPLAAIPVPPPSPQPAAAQPEAAQTAGVASDLQPAGRSSDVDGARLIALNMALNGDSREQTDRYLSEHFDLPERAKLVDEVYAAIEG
ncbi:MAG TPA: hypothetical protein VGF95_10365 [Solirubrobacteraceae bacterium]